MGDFRFLWPLLRRRGWWMLASMVLALLTTLAGLGLLATAGWLVAAAALAGLSAVISFELFRPSALIRLCALTRTGGRYAERVSSHETTFRLLTDLRIWFYQRLIPLSPGGLARFRSGDLLNRLVADIQALDNLFLRVLAPSFTALAVGLAMGWLLGRWSWGWALAVVGCLVGAGAVVPMVAARLGAASGVGLGRELAALRGGVVDTVQGLGELLVYGVVGHHLGDLAKRQDRHLGHQNTMNRIQAASGALQTLLSGLALWATLYLGAELVSAGRVDGPLVAGLALMVLAAFEVVQPLPLAYQYLGQTRSAAGRLKEIIEAPAAVTFVPRSVSTPNGVDLQIDHLSFAYRPGQPVLSEIAFNVSAGGRVAVMGPSGSGKSTLAQLLVRFFDPDQGAILLGGVDIRDLAETDLRRLVGLVSQRSHLFSGTVRENLHLARPGASEQELWACLEVAHLADTVRQLPEGLDTWLGEGGMRLSGGQIRRMVVARTLLRDPPVLILDEPTEGLDAITAEALLGALDSLMAERTVILVSHRLADLGMVERVVLLEGGRQLAEGPVASMRNQWPQLAGLAERPTR